MANKKISGMTNASALTGVELVPIVQGGANRKTTTQDIANLGTGGGGGTPLAEGLGISFDTITNPGTTTVNNTGTIIQPGTAGTGVLLRGGNGTTIGGSVGVYAGNAEDLTAFGGNAYQYAGDATVTSPGTYGKGGGALLQAGIAISGTVQAQAARIGAKGGLISGYGLTIGGYAYLTGGGSPGQGGDVSITSGDGGAGPGGNVNIILGTGSTNGVLLVAGLATTAGVSGAVFRAGTTSTNGGFALYISP